MKVKIYARYSSDHQSDHSIEDQVRICKERAKKEGWTVTEILDDRAISGSSLFLRPGIQKLLSAIRNRECDIILTESIDRLSRSIEDAAHIYRRAKHRKIRIVTLADGEISEMHIGLKGTMGELYLKDLAQKTHRGLQGVALEGKSAGGKSYGYDSVLKHDARGDRIRGDRTINEVEAEIVRRIFREYVGGKSPKTIAVGLNKDGISSPRGGDWGQSTINGNRQRGTGILNNELYIGRQVWNRQQYSKNPDTGLRNSQLRPEKDLIVTAVPELRLIDQELWDRAKAIQGNLQFNCNVLWKARRPRGLFSNLIKCAKCGGGYSKISATLVGCSTARNKGTCDNRRAMRVDVLEEKVLGALRGRLMNEELCREFCKEYTTHMNRVRIEHNASLAGFKGEREKNEREINKLIDAITKGIDPLQVKDRINALSERQRQLTALVERTPDAPPLIHPGMAHRYHVWVKNLIETLNEPEHRDESASLIRKLVDKIVLTPNDANGLSIDLHGDLAGILQVSIGKLLPGAKKRAASEVPSEAAGLQQVTLVAGIGFEPMTFRL
jgi:site-specific DNA recombinase